MSIDFDIIRKVLQSLRDHPEEHIQDVWFDTPVVDEPVEVSLEDLQEERLCGTNACIAGWIALHGGWRFKSYEEQGPYGPEIEVVLVHDDHENEVSIHSTPDLAQDILGDPEGESGIRRIFFVTDSERYAIALLTFFYLNEAMPSDRLDWDSYVRYTDGMTRDEFTEKWYGRFMTDFVPSRKVEVV